MITNRMGLEKEGRLSDEFIDSLAERVDHADCYGGKTWFDCHEGAVIIAALRELLAYREGSTHPIGITDKSEIECLTRGEMANVMPSDYKGVDKGDEVLIYAAPPIQAVTVPDKATWRDAPVNSENVDWAAGWNTCRAAMLKSVINEP